MDAKTARPCRRRTGLKIGRYIAEIDELIEKLEEELKERAED